MVLLCPGHIQTQKQELAATRTSLRPVWAVWLQRWSWWIFVSLQTLLDVVHTLEDIDPLVDPVHLSIFVGTLSALLTIALYIFNRRTVHAKDSDEKTHASKESKKYYG